MCTAALHCLLVTIITFNPANMLQYDVCSVGNMVTTRDKLSVAGVAPEGRAMPNVVKERICVICRRVTDLPKPKVASERRQCAECHEPIWVAKKWPAASVKICSHCMKRDGTENSSKLRRSRLH